MFVRQTSAAPKQMDGSEPAEKEPIRSKLFSDDNR
jgi:hypothetical protein